MKVKDLLNIIKNCDENSIIILSSDPEGNTFRKLVDVELENTSYNEEEDRTGITNLTPELTEEGYSEEDVVKGTSCIVLWP